jgi:glycerate 2-kinase
MAAAAARRLGAHIRNGLVITPDPASVPDPFESIVGGHPLPTPASEAAGRRALAIAEAIAPAGTLIVLISGGASALMVAPADGITLDDKRAATAQLLRAGADIHALNTVRKHLSDIKGGGLAARCRGTCRAFAISDVVGDDLSVIASGPTVPDSSRFRDALDVLARFGGEGAYPAAVVARLRAGVQGLIPDTPKPDDERLARATTRVIGTRRDAMNGAAAAASALGYEVLRIDDPVVGEARRAGASHMRAALARSDGMRRPLCVVSSGETTVHVTGNGKGGRNQEFALAAAATIAPVTRPVVVASAGTDGIDGPTDAAGAVADDTTLARATSAGVSAERALAENDAYTFFAALGDLIHTGPTGTNVGDLQIILLA